MRVLREVTTRGERWALTAVAVALFGLMSMHGWGSHGAQPLATPAHEVAHSHASATNVAAAESGAALSAVDVAKHAPADAQVYRTAALGPGASASTPGTSSSASGSDVGHGQHDDASSLMELCLAILTGLVLTAMLWSRHRGVPALSAWLPSWPLPAVAGRDRDPPDLLRLCVVRC